jgi:DNA invertase Pin-like site-specific DNA recombinase
MAKYGYARVSSVDQDCAIQVAALQKSGCEIIRQEKVSARNVDDRPELKTLLEFLRSGDELVVTRIDRLARSTRDLCNIVYDLKKRGVALRVLQQQIDTSTAAGSAFLAMLGVFAEFENEIRRERQMAGIERAKLAGKYVGKGRPPVCEPEKVRHSVVSIGASATARKFSISRATVYRCVNGSLS